MATWSEQNCPSFKTAAGGFKHGFSRSLVRCSNHYATALDNTNNGFINVVVFDPIVICSMTFPLNELKTGQH